MYKLLIVDDEPFICAAMGKRPLWRELGITEIKTVDNVECALEIIPVFKPDIVFTDLVMPERDGFDLMNAIKAQGILTRIVVLSGYNEFEYASRAMRLGASAYVLKPTDDTELKEIFMDLIAQIEAQRTPHIKAKPYDQLETVLRYIENNYARQITLKEVASVARMNTSYFCTFFKQKRGMRFSDYINFVRIEKAKYFLKSTDQRISEICNLVGFREMSYFCRVFKKTTGSTPSDYREML